MIKLGRFGFAIVTALACGLGSSSSALAWDFAPLSENATSATSGFIPSQNVTVNMSAVVIAAHATPSLPTISPYNSAIPIVNVEPVVTAGQRPLVVGGAPCAVSIYGVDAAGNLYNISSAAWMTPPRVVKWQGGTIIPNQPTDTNTILRLGYTINSNANGQMVGMSFSEQAPAVQPNPATNIQVSAAVVMNNPLPNGAWQSWTFNDMVNTIAAGSVAPPPAPTYDVTIEVPANPPYTMRLLNVPGASLTAAP